MTVCKIVQFVKYLSLYETVGYRSIKFGKHLGKIIILVLRSIVDTKVIKKTFVLSHKLMLETVPKEELNVFLAISNINERISSSIKQ